MLSRQDALSPITFIAERTLTNLADSQKNSIATPPAIKPNRPAFADRLKKSQSHKPQPSIESSAIARPESAPSKKASGSTQVHETKTRQAAENTQKEPETRIDPAEDTVISNEDLKFSATSVNPIQNTDPDEVNLDGESLDSEAISTETEKLIPVEVTVPLSLLSATARRQQDDTSNMEVVEESGFSGTGTDSLAPLTFFNALDQNKSTTRSPLESQPVLSNEELQAALKVAGVQTETSSETEVLNPFELQNQKIKNENLNEATSSDIQESSGITDDNAVAEVQLNSEQVQNSESQKETEQSTQASNDTPTLPASSVQNNESPSEGSSESETAKSNGEIQLSQTEDVVQNGQVELKSENQIEVHKKEQPTEVDSEEQFTSEDSNSQQPSRYGNSSVPVTEHIIPQTNTSTDDVSGRPVTDPSSATRVVSLETASTKITSSEEQITNTRFSETNATTAENRTSVSDVKAEVTRPVLDTSKSDIPQRLASFIQQAAEQGKALKIRLHPPELGTLQIEVNRLNGQVTAKIEVESAAARAVIFEQLGLLKESLTQQGIKVDQLQVEINEQLANESGNSFSSESGSSDMTQDQKHQREHFGTTGVEQGETGETEEISNAPASKIGVSEMDVQV